MNYRIRKNDGKWRRMKGLDDLAYAIYDLSPRDTLEVKVECEHEDTFVESGIKTCKKCGEQLEVTSWRD